MIPSPEAALPIEPRQRWRITFAREAVAADAVGRPLLEAWQDSVTSSGLPVARQADSSGRIRIAFAAPLPAAARGEREWADLWLVERVPAWRVRETLEPRLPAAHAWVDAEDVWLGSPALAGQVAAADWRIEVEPVDAAACDAVTAAAEALGSARTIPRIRTKGAEQKVYDLRPLLGEVGVERTGDRLTVVARTRFHPELGSGRPEEVVGALAEAASVPLAIAAMTRCRLLLADEPVARRRR